MIPKCNIKSYNKSYVVGSSQSIVDSLPDGVIHCSQQKHNRTSDHHDFLVRQHMGRRGWRCSSSSCYCSCCCCSCSGETIGHAEAIRYDEQKQEELYASHVLIPHADDYFWKCGGASVLFLPGEIDRRKMVSNPSWVGNDIPYRMLLMMLVILLITMMMMILVVRDT